MLKGKVATDRFKTGKIFSGMMTHHTEVFGLEDIDDELTDWLRDAYENA